MNEGVAPGDPSSEPTRQWWRAPVLLLLAPGLLCFGLSAYQAMSKPLFVGGDERAHLLYVASIIDGRLPEVGDDYAANERLPIVQRSLEGTAKDEPIRGVWVAYHPPLPYVAAAPVVWAAGAVGPDTWPAVAMRLVNASWTAAGVVLVGLFASEAFPRRRGIGFAAACLTAVVPSLASTGSAGMTDGSAFAVAAGCWYLAARLLRRGPTRGTMAAACVAAPAAMLTRVSVAPIAAMLGGAALLSVWRHRRGSAAWVRSVGAGLLVGAATIVASGWFYWRNHELYGRLTAPEAPPEFARPSPGSFVEIFTGRHYHQMVWSAMYGSVTGPLTYVHAERVLAGLLAILLVGFGVAAFRNRTRLLAAVRRVRPAAPGAPSAAGSTDGIGVAGWALVLATSVAVVMGTAQFYSQGGQPAARYLFPVLPVASVLLARAIDELPLRRLALAAVVAFLGALVVTQYARVPELVDTLPLVAPFDRSAVAPAALRVAQGVALVAALACVWIGWRFGGDGTVAAAAVADTGGDRDADADPGGHPPDDGTEPDPDAGERAVAAVDA